MTFNIVGGLFTFSLEKSILSSMEYVLFASLALLASAGNTIFNRLGANHASALANSTIKSFFIVVACFFICLAFGHVPTLYSLSLEQWGWIGLVGALTCIDWFFYFLAIKRSHLEAFAPFCASGILFFSNLVFSIFTFGMVTNNGKPINVVLYFIGLAFLLGSLIYILLNKKINPSSKKIWVIYALASVISFAFVLLVAKTKLIDIPPDVISFHQMTIVFAVMFIATMFTKTYKEIVKIKKLDFVYIVIGAIFNALMMVFRYKAFSYTNSVPAIVNVIIGLDFVLVSIATVIFFKAKNKPQIMIMIALVVVGMILDVLAGLI